jgi:hypothetical protein
MTLNNLNSIPVKLTSSDSILVRQGSVDYKSTITQLVKDLIQEPIIKTQLGSSSNPFGSANFTNLTVGNSGTVNGNLSVTGGASSSSTTASALTSSKTLTVKGTLTVDGDLNNTGNMKVNGTTDANNLTAGNLISTAGRITNVYANGTFTATKELVVNTKADVNTLSANTVDTTKGTTTLQTGGSFTPKVLNVANASITTLTANGTSTVVDTGTYNVKTTLQSGGSFNPTKLTITEANITTLNANGTSTVVDTGTNNVKTTLQSGGSFNPKTLTVNGTTTATSFTAANINTLLNGASATVVNTFTTDTLSVTNTSGTALSRATSFTGKTLEVKNGTTSVTSSSPTAFTTDTLKVCGASSITNTSTGFTTSILNVTGTSTLASLNTESKVTVTGTTEVSGTFTTGDTTTNGASITTLIAQSNVNVSGTIDGIETATVSGNLAQSGGTIKDVTTLIINGYGTATNGITAGNVNIAGNNITYSGDSSNTTTLNFKGTASYASDLLAEHVIDISKDQTEPTTWKGTQWTVKQRNTRASADATTPDEDSKVTITDHIYTGDNGGTNDEMISVETKTGKISHKAPDKNSLNNSSTSFSGGMLEGSGSSTPLEYGGTISIPKIEYDKFGHITGTSTTSVILPQRLSRSLRSLAPDFFKNSDAGNWCAGETNHDTLQIGPKIKFTSASSKREDYLKRGITYPTLERQALKNSEGISTYTLNLTIVGPEVFGETVRSDNRGYYCGLVPRPVSNSDTDLIKNNGKEYEKVNMDTAAAASPENACLNSLGQWIVPKGIDLRPTTNTFLQKNYFTAGGTVGTSSTPGVYDSGTKTLTTEGDGAINIPNGGLVAEGGIKGSKVYNAVWNDLADCIPVNEEAIIEPGYCYCFDGEKYYKATKYLEKGIIGIESDTYGMHMGSKSGVKQMDVAVSGFALAYVDKEYEPGTPLTCTENGYLTEIAKQDKIEYPERIVGTYWKPEKEEYWGSKKNKVRVKGRHWIRIK